MIELFKVIFMQEVPLIIKIWNMIKNFFKMLILYIIKFILIIFGLEDKEEKVLEILGEAGKKQIADDLAVTKAAQFLVENAKEV